MGLRDGLTKLEYYYILLQQKSKKKTLRKTAECGGWRTEVQTCVAQWMNGTRSYVRKIVIM